MLTRAQRRASQEGAETAEASSTSQAPAASKRATKAAKAKAKAKPAKKGGKKNGSKASNKRPALENITNATSGRKKQKATTARRRSNRLSGANELGTHLIPASLCAREDEPLPEDVRDIDAGEDYDPMLVSEYAKSVYKLLFEVEQKYRPDPEYMLRQTDINSNMRGILVDWLVEVAEEYKLHTETLFLSINYVDRFLSKNNVVRGKLQLVGITCMLVASKYEEIYPPSVEDFVYISDNAYTREQVITQEVVVLNSLNFHCTVATCRQFLRRFAKAAMADHTTHEMSHYLSELSLLDDKFIAFNTSMIAASALLISICTNDFDCPWDETMAYYTTYTYEELLPCAELLLTVARQSYYGTATFKAVKDKYATLKFDCVAGRMPCSELYKP